MIKIIQETYGYVSSKEQEEKMEQMSLKILKVLADDGYTYGETLAILNNAKEVLNKSCLGNKIKYPE